jgi:hypothetical protein
MIHMHYILNTLTLFIPNITKSLKTEDQKISQAKMLYCHCTTNQQTWKGDYKWNT